VFRCQKDSEVVAGKIKDVVPVLASFGLGPFAPNTTGTDARLDCSSGMGATLSGSGVHSSTTSSISCQIVSAWINRENFSGQTFPENKESVFLRYLQGYGIEGRGAWQREFQEDL
jgi:hypothetical protein